MKKTLTQHEYMQGLALFTVAQTHYNKSREFEAALCALVEADEDCIYAGCISDALYNEESFDSGLKRQGIAIEPDVPK